METIYFEYRFKFADKDTIEYSVAINKQTKTIIHSNINNSNLPEWTKLDFLKCSHCPLSANTHPNCPVAVRLSNLIVTFKNHSSIEEVNIEVETQERTYSNKTRLQYGLQSLFGLLMAASGCPRMAFLAPLVISHLPFAKIEDTLIRVSSTYLLSQFFKNLDGEVPDYTMEGLMEQYQDVNIVNQGIVKRIKSIGQTGDAAVNAITILDAFAQYFNLEFKFDLQQIKYLFS